MGWDDRLVLGSMRRALSISLILLLWLPALVALLPASGESRLPFCCRRQGAHHCASAAAQNDGPGASLRAPLKCAQFPAARPAISQPAFFIARAPAHWPALVSGHCARISRREAARTGLLRAQVDRGPPSPALA